LRLTPSHDPPAPPPVPVAAWTIGAQRDLWVQFDQELYDQHLDKTNWTLYYGNQRRFMNSANVVLGKVFCQTYNAGWTSKPNSVDFAPPPSDVMNLDRVPAVGFAGFLLS